VVTAFQDGGYEKGPLAAVSVVPKPGGIVLVIGLLSNPGAELPLGYPGGGRKEQMITTLND
jgi:hypothetical protein